MSLPDAERMVGRVLDPSSLPGGAVLVMKAARKAGSWSVWATRATVSRPVKVLAGKDAPDGVPVYEERPAERVFVKGRRGDGRRFVVPYLDGKAGTAYMLTSWHRCLVPGSLLSLSNTKATTDPVPYLWRTERPSFVPVSITDLRGYMNAEGEL